MLCVADLPPLWLEQAGLFRRRGLEQQALMAESFAEELEAEIREEETELLTIAQAAAESGYTEEHLRELVRAGRIPDNRRPGSQGTILVRCGDLPRKPGQRQSVSAVEDMAAKLLDVCR